MAKLERKWGEVLVSRTVNGEMQDEEGPSDGEDGSKGHDLVGSSFEDPDGGTCEVTGY
jgi:hypothetical protein